MALAVLVVDPASVGLLSHESSNSSVADGASLLFHTGPLKESVAGFAPAKSGFDFRFIHPLWWAGPDQRVLARVSYHAALTLLNLLCLKRRDAL